jgi:glycosyltransferase involved in cell wall biosynthesis
VKTVAIVVPVYNEEEGLPHFYATISETCHALSKAHSVKFSLVFVDDGSRDKSADVVAGFKASDADVTLLSLSRNFGKEAAVSAGLAAAQDHDATIIMDADLQHPPELLAVFIRHWLDDGMDVVYAYKENRSDEGLGKSLFSMAFYRLINSGNRYQIPPNAGDFRLMNRAAVRALLAMPENERFMKGLYAWIGFKQLGVPFLPPKRAAGKTSFAPLQLILLSMDGLTSFSVAPLRFMAVFGFGISMFSFLYLAFILFERLILGQEIPGFASVITLVAFFGGVQLICLGIIGEYIGKTLIEAKGRPQYIVANRVDIPALSPLPKKSAAKSPAKTKNT